MSTFKYIQVFCILETSINSLLVVTVNLSKPVPEVFTLGLSEEAEYWFLQSIKEAPYLREGYVELASFYILKDNYESAYSLLKKALKIKEKSKSYINEEFAWNDAFYDLLSLAAYYTNHKKESLTYVKKAIKLNPKNTRYQENLSIIKQNL